MLYTKTLSFIHKKLRQNASYICITLLLVFISQTHRGAVFYLPCYLCAPRRAPTILTASSRRAVGGVWVALLLSLIFSFSLMNLLIQISGLVSASKRSSYYVYRRKTKSQRPRAPAPACSSPKNPRGAR